MSHPPLHPLIPSTNDAVQPDPWDDLRRFTAARLALGRVGGSLPTAELLKLGAAQAEARDAVHRALDVPKLAAAIEAQGLATRQVRSAAPDRPSYLLRPDLGRRLAADDRASLQPDTGTGIGTNTNTSTSTNTAIDLLLVVADGLSAFAIEHHAAALIAQVLAQRPPGWTLGPVVIATQARVALGDEVGERLGARLVAVLIGERPGLSSPDSLGIYLTWAPRVGRPDSERNCISNVRPQGLALPEAARKLWWLAEAARRLDATGVALKDGSDAVAIDGPIERIDHRSDDA